MASIEIDRITKVYDNGFLAVDDVSLEVRDGEFMVLVGPSGCGKSTLLRMIAGLEEVTAGTVRIGGSDVTELAPRHRDIAMVFQSYALYPHMSVRDNLGYGLKVRKVPKADARRRVEEVAAMLGLTEMLDRKPLQLSGGQRQRVAMGRAIVREPQAFLMDEPLSNLDAKLRVGMRASLAQLHAKLGVTTVYVTHDQTEAMTLGQRVAVLRDGKVVQVADPQTLYRSPTNLFVAAFIGSPAMNLVDASIEADEVVFGGLRVPLDGERRPTGEIGRVVLGVRPEAFEDAELAPPDLPRADGSGRGARGARRRHARLLPCRQSASLDRHSRCRGGRGSNSARGGTDALHCSRRSPDADSSDRERNPRRRPLSLSLLRPRGRLGAPDCGVPRPSRPRVPRR